MISRQAILKTKGDSGKIGQTFLPFSKRAKKRIPGRSRYIYIYTELYLYILYLGHLQATSTYTSLSPGPSFGSVLSLLAGAVASMANLWQSMAYGRYNELVFMGFMVYKPTLNQQTSAGGAASCR